MKARHPSLISILTHRLFWIAAIVVIANWIVITMHYTSDRSELDGQVLASEFSKLQKALAGTPTRVADDARALFLEHSESYAFAVVDEKGQIIDSENAELIPTMALGAALLSEDWSTHITRDEQSVLVGSQIITSPNAAGRLVFVMGDDPAGLKTKALIAELAMHVWLPILPMAIVLIGSNALMIRHGLKPVSVAAEWARNLGPNKPIPPLPDIQLPAEVVDLVDASQRSLQQLNLALALEKRQAAEMAHALRTPLAVLVARLDALPDKPESEKLKEEVHHLAHTVEQVLTASRADALEVDETAALDLVEVSQSVLANEGAFAHRHGVTLSLVADKQPVFAIADRDAVELTLSNLIQNAVMHGGQGGVEVVVKPDCSIVIRDEGPGLPSGDPEQLFDAFTRGKGAVKGGSGLGLAIVKRLQLAQQGNVSARSLPEGGAEFLLTYRPSKT